MAFIQPCFIRTISNELCDKLTELGYKDCWTCGIHTDELKTITYVGNQCWCLTGFEPRNSIDCGTNEELFLALAALRDDTNEKQWFIMDVGAYTNINVGDWFIATDMNGGKHIGIQIEPTYCHKATVEEIVEHFKDK